MSNKDSAVTAGLQLEAECTPDPILTRADHMVAIQNVSTDRYTIKLQARVLGPSIAHGASLAFYEDQKPKDIVVWTAGTFGPGAPRAAWTKALNRHPAGTAKAHSIRTLASFNSEAESDPLDDEPRPYDYFCHCVVDVVLA
jgi:hypothetical protein